MIKSDIKGLILCNNNSYWTYYSQKLCGFIATKKDKQSLDQYYGFISTLSMYIINKKTIWIMYGKDKHKYFIDKT